MEKWSLLKMPWLKVEARGRFRKHCCSSGRHATSIRQHLTYHGEG